MQIIGFSGIKGSGKSTAAQFLVQQCGFIEYSFATPLKRAVKELFLLNDRQLFGNKKEKNTRWGLSARRIMQQFGNLVRTEFPGRFNINNLWIKHFEIFVSEFKERYPNAKGIVVSDVRFINEQRAIRKLGGKIVYINTNTRIKDLDDSELELLPVNVIDFIFLIYSTFILFGLIMYMINPLQLTCIMIITTFIGFNRNTIKRGSLKYSFSWTFQYIYFITIAISIYYAPITSLLTMISHFYHMIKHYTYKADKPDLMIYRADGIPAFCRQILAISF